jgi:hypothetical protein
VWKGNEIKAARHVGIERKLVSNKRCVNKAGYRGRSVKN